MASGCPGRLPPAPRIPSRGALPRPVPFSSMCGIFGHTRYDAADVDRSRRALHTLSHRGPDQWSDWQDERVYSGHRRLSIIDLSERGRQPMLDESGQVVLSANGEIYNFRDLRLELERDAVFRSESDSEVLLHGYRAWGIDGLLERIDGMFAFALYDAQLGKIFLARDRLGIKPLYYAWNGELAWASELKALTSFFGDRLRVDPTALYDFLTYLYVPSPKTLYRDVFKLLPGELVEFDCADKRLTTRRYWHLSSMPGDVGLREGAARIRELVGRSVSDQMVSDVPVGFFLSGGIDSSVVVAEATECSDSVHTFTIGFTDANRDETPHANRIAELFGTRHTVEMLSVPDVAELFGDLRTWYDEPFGDTSAFPSYLVARLARRRATVVLTGDGGDEVFGGYNRYRRLGTGLVRRLPRIPALRPLTASAGRSSNRTLRRVSRRLETALVASDLENYVRVMGGMVREEKQRYAEAWEIPADYDDYWYFRQHLRDDLPPRRRLQYLDLHTYLHDDILTKMDRVSMAVSLEARVPLLSHKVVEYAFGLPEDVTYAGGELKGVLRRAYADVLPDEILARPKQGFSIPPTAYREELDIQGHDRQVTILTRLFGDCLPDASLKPAAS